MVTCWLFRGASSLKTPRSCGCTDQFLWAYPQQLCLPVGSQCQHQGQPLRRVQGVLCQQATVVRARFQVWSFWLDLPRSRLCGTLVLMAPSFLLGFAPPARLLGPASDGSWITCLVGRMWSYSLFWYPYPSMSPNYHSPPGSIIVLVRWRV